MSKNHRHLHTALETRHSKFPSTLSISCNPRSRATCPAQSDVAGSTLALMTLANAADFSVWALVIGHFKCSFPCAHPRIKAPPASTSLCMVCMIRREIKITPESRPALAAISIPEAAPTPKVHWTGMHIESDPCRSKSLCRPHRREPRALSRAVHVAGEHLPPSEP